MPCLEKFRETLAQFQIPEYTIQQIEAGYEGITSKTPKKKTATYFKRAIDILTEQIEPQVMIDLLASNACCKGGAREKALRHLPKPTRINPLKGS